MKDTEQKIFSAYDVVDEAMDLHYPSGDTLGREQSNIPERIHLADDYVLQRISLDSIEEADVEIDEDAVEEYAKLSADTAPPIVWNGEEIVDGNHRYLASIRCGDKEILAYVPRNASVA